jgi:poly(hydroxyalkanoate) depolymerase family esterase
VPGLRPTIPDLLRRQQRWARERGRWWGWAPFRLPAADADTEEGEAARAGLAEVADFGPNPGALRMLARVPEDQSAGVALVVVLHGCTQSAAAFDRACGWSNLATRLGFALLLPEQRRANNPKRCFNWFAASDTRRDAGEALSIGRMVDRMLAGHALDPKRVYIAGLSAGGAMVAAMLAAYPEVFAGGAVIGGMPYGAATSARQARPWLVGWTTAPSGAGAMRCVPPRRTVDRGRGSRSGTATPTGPCIR